MWGVQSGGFDLQAFDGGVNKASGTAATGFFTEDIPRFEGLADFDVDAGGCEGADERTAKFELSTEPGGFHGNACGIQVSDNVVEILPEAVWEEELVVDGVFPVDQRFEKGAFPEGDRKSANEQLLNEAHTFVGRHFEATEFDESESSCGVIGGEEFVDTDFSAGECSRSDRRAGCGRVDRRARKVSSRSRVVEPD
jgi:hypothetical protein